MGMTEPVNLTESDELIGSAFARHNQRRGPHERVKIDERKNQVLVVENWKAHNCLKKQDDLEVELE